MSIGFRILDKDDFQEHVHTRLLTELEAPLSNTTMAHHYNLTTTGEALNLSQLFADLVSHQSLSAILVHERGGTRIHDEMEKTQFKI